MRMRSRHHACAVVILSSTLLRPSLPEAQTRDTSSTGKSTYVPKRTADGQPDIQGVYSHRNDWGVASLEFGYSPNGGTGHHEKFDPPAIRELTQRSSANTPAAPRKENPWLKTGQEFCGGQDTCGGVEGGKIPYQPWARAQKNEMYKIYTGKRVDTIQELDPVARCLPAGIPRAHGLVGPHQIFQAPGIVAIFDEQSHQYRIIRIDGGRRVGPAIRLWMGDSRGRWEGNTLVVDTTNYNGKHWLDESASFVTEALHTVERFTIVDANTIAYELTVEDPKVFTAPWKITSTFSKAADTELMEEECLEGSRFDNYGFK